MIGGLHPEDFPFIRPYLENFASRSLGRWDAAQIERDLLARDRQAWAAVENGDVLMVALTRVDHENVYIDAAAGKERGKWAAALDETITEWARSLGKKRVISMARPGWSREARALGYRETHREFAKELT